MKKVVYPLISVLIIMIVSGCGSKQNARVKELYKSFMSGEICATDENGVEKSLEKYFTRYSQSETDYDYTYTFYDMNNDGAPELCIKAYPDLCFFTVKEGKIYHWYTDDRSWTKLLNNGALLYERHGGAPTHINYAYTELEQNAKAKFYVEFSWWDETVENGKVYPEYYEFDGKAVSKKEYGKLTGKYLTVGTDEIVWYNKSGA